MRNLFKYFFLLLFLEVSFCIPTRAQTLNRKEEPTLAGIVGGKAEWENSEATLGNFGNISGSPNGTVFSITRDQVDAGQGIIIAGSFDSIGSIASNRIAEYSDNSTWVPLGTGIQNGVVYSTVSTYIHPNIYVPLLFAGGTFTVAGGLSVNHIAMWDGSSWHTLGNAVGVGVDSTVLAMAIIGDSLYVGGNFTHAGGQIVNHLAIWNIDSNRWEPIVDNGVVGVDGGVAALLVPYEQRILYVGGGFLTAGPTPVAKIATLNYGHWNSLKSGIVDSTGIVEALCEGSIPFRNGEIIVGGHFKESGVTNFKVWKPSDSTWSTNNVFLGMTGTIYSLTNPVHLYVGGDFTLSDSSKYFFQVDGSNAGPTIDGTVYALLGEGGIFPEGYDETIYLGGNFVNPQPHFTKWGESMDVPLNGPKVNRELSIFPNPFTDNSTLRINLKNRSHVEFSIYNLIGEKVVTLSEDNYDAGIYDFNLNNTSLLSNNAYYARLNIDGNITSSLLIKR